MIRLAFILLCLSQILFSDSSFSSETGEVILDAGADGLNQVRISPDGALAIGSTSTSGNLLNVGGNVKVYLESNIQKLHLQTGMELTYQNVSSDTSLGNKPLVFADSSIQNLTLSLPQPDEGLMIQIKKTSASNHVTIDAGAGIKINENQTIVISGNIGLGQVKLLASSGHWKIISKEGVE